MVDTRITYQPENPDTEQIAFDHAFTTLDSPHPKTEPAVNQVRAMQEEAREDVVDASSTSTRRVENIEIGTTGNKRLPWTALHQAAERGDVGAAQKELESGAEINEPDANGWTSLHVAASNGHENIVKYLVGYGAQVDSLTNDGQTVLHSAVDNNHVEIEQYLLRTSDLADHRPPIFSNLPPQPATFTDEQWHLLKRVCAFDPQQRITIPTLVRELRSFVNQEAMNGMSEVHDSTSESYINVKEYRVRDLNNIRIALALKRIESFRSQSETVNLMNQRVYARLADIYNQMQELDQISHSLFKKYVKILVRFYNDLRASTLKSLLVNFTASRQIANNTYSIHEELDRLMQPLGLSRVDSIHHWIAKWKADKQQEMDRFAVWLNDIESLLRSLSENEQERAEALTYLLFELSKHRSSYDTIYTSMINQACAKILSTPGISVADWFIPPYEVNFDEFDAFSEGAYGSVHHGVWLDSDVVVKKVLIQDDEDHRQIFEREVAIWFKLIHPHIVKLFGACHVGDQPFFVCEYASNGQLDSFLKKHPKQTWRKLYEASLGLQYLHERGIVHGDLKCNNILIGSDGLAKLTDFGLSLDNSVAQDSNALDEDQKEIGAIRWKAPECLNGKKPSFASDVYSFGMCILEAVSGKFPWGNKLEDSVVKYHVKRGVQPKVAQFVSVPQ